MANPHKRLGENVPGDFYVDSTCIDCDTCRQLVPEVFAEGGNTRSSIISRKRGQIGGGRCRRSSLVRQDRLAPWGTTIPKRQ